MPRKFYQPIAAVVLTLALQGCAALSADAPAPAPEPNADEVFRQGEDLLKKGSYEQARQKYSKVKEHDPERSYDILVQLRLGDSYYEEARYAEAEVEYKRFLDLHPHNKAAPYAKYQIGMCNFKQMDRADRDPSFAAAAMKQFSELLKDYPNNPYEEEAREKLRVARGKAAEHEYVVGWYYYKRGTYPAAAKRFKGILESYPGSKDEPETMYYLADSYIRMGDYESAKQMLAVLNTAHPNHRMAQKAQKGLAEKIPAQ